jgi:gliding motility-associated-like protein
LLFLLSTTISYTCRGRLILFLCSLFLCFVANAQLSADFTANPIEGCAPVVVQFTDQSAGNPVAWLWDLGNGNTSASRNPSTIYFNPGTYTVKLVVTNASGIDSVIKTDFIVVSDKPTVNFSANNAAGCFPFLVTFTDQSMPVSGAITDWEWDFGDGNVSTDQSPTHIYTAPGNFTVTLKVTNSAGCVNVTTKTGYIRVNESPQAGFNSTSSASCNPPVTVNFTNTSVSSSSATYSWNFGDGATSAASNPSHNYGTAGTFNVRLTVTNATGCRDTITRAVVIGRVAADFDTPDTICQGTPVTFVNTSNPATVSSAWSFGDGTISTAINPIKAYATAGRFTVKLVNNFGACKDSITKTITVLPQPSADFTYTAPPPGCSVPVTVSFTSSSAGAASYLWNFGDGTTSTLANPTHVYNVRGTFSVSLIVKSAAGCTDTIVKQGVVSIVSPNVVSLNTVPISGCIPFTNNFTATVTSPEPIKSYFWNFGDGSTSTQANPLHTYRATGTYTVSLTITTNGGCVDSLSVLQAVKVGAKPQAGFTATPRNICASQEVQFTNTTVGTTNEWFWIFSDSAFSSLQNPTYSYKDTGYFTVSLIATNNGCSDTVTFDNYIYVKPPVSLFQTRHRCDSPYLKRFINKSVAAQTLQWDFGDGTTSTVANPTHIFSKTGRFFVKLTVTSPPCVDEFTDTVYVIDERPDIAFKSNIICRRGIGELTATNINPAYIRRYEWNFGDGTPVVVTTVPQVIHRYNTSGVFSTTLTIVDRLNCKRVVTKPQSVTVYGPKAGFTNPAGSCINAPVTFTNQSQPYPGFPIVRWVINYGDGKADTTTSPVLTHTYNAPGTYTVTMVITDQYGCTDSLVKPAAIIISNPKANFRIADSLVCNSTPVNFVSTSSGSTLTYLWHFGDGTSATVRNPAHAYTAEGVYTVSLVVKDKFGCTDSIAKDSIVTIGNPKAAFNMSDSVISCPPAQISFTSNAVNFESIRWDFGDGSSSDILNPVHYFLNAGTYKVKLVIQGYGNCADSSVKTVFVKGPSGTITYTPLANCAPATVNFTGSSANSTSNFTWDFGDGNTVTTTSNTASHIYRSVGRYLPKLLLSDTVLNCQVAIFGSDTISVTGANAFIKTQPLVFCDSATVRFTDSSVVLFDTINTYLWNFGDGQISGVKNPVHVFSAPGHYPVRLTVTTNGGCSETSDTMYVKVVKSPALTVRGDTSTCINRPVTFAALVAQPDTSSILYSWRFGNGNTSTVQSPGAQTYTTAGNFNVILVGVNSSGCRDSAIKKLSVYPLPNVNAGTDTTICLGQNLTLSPSGALSYSWISNHALSCSNCTNPVARPVDSVQTYIVTGTSAQSCTNTDSITVKVVKPFRITASLRDTLCAGEQISLSASGADTYTWSPASSINNPTSSNPVATPPAPVGSSALTTVYTVVGRDFKGCFADSVAIPIIVYPVPQFNIIPGNVTTNVGNIIPLTTTSSADITSYAWTPATGLSCSNCPQPNASPNNTTTYRATVTNQGGCIAQDQVTLTLFCNNGNIFIPNTFSPNNDGANDIFYPRGKGISTIRNLLVFNRWGTVVYQRTNIAANDPTVGWDGTYNGKPLDPDVFVYHLQVICGNGESFLFKGDLTLIK